MTKKKIAPPISDVPYVVMVWNDLWTLNNERTKHWGYRKKMVKEWRSATCVAVKARKIPFMKKVKVTFTPYVATKRKVDTANHFPVLKAMVDGLVDAGVLSDDGPDIVTIIVFNAPVFAGEKYAKLEILELE
jgi:crossover junction endodeoxyribonuclease RusA